jgi:serine/threonine protein kinase
MSKSKIINPPVATEYEDRHCFLVAGTQFVVDKHYKPLKPVGSGAYGVVCTALNTKTNAKVAIKKINRAYQDLIDAKRILREVKLLNHFDHENIIKLVDMVNPLNANHAEDVYMVLDFMETDLHKIIYSRNKLSDEHCQYFIYQMLRGLKYMHGANVIHRDLKPSNLLLNSNCDLKICDFGLSRGVDDEADYELTEYVVTRWYRAPEIMCACNEYDAKIDVWAVGCIFGEILGRKPLFPGENYIHQLNLIFGALGTPTGDNLSWISNSKALQYIRSLRKKERVPFQKIYPNASPLAIDLLTKLLEFNPHKRISVDEALAHPYLQSLHNPEEEVSLKHDM